MGDLAEVKLKNVFNPYADVCSVFDRSERSPAIRASMLIQHLEAVAKIDSRVMWMGRDLGYRGGRRTGIALTDEVHLDEFFRLYGGNRTERPTIGPAVAERTASEVWRVLSLIDRPPVLWNVFPFHPHEAGNEFSNRKFTSVELSVLQEFNSRLLRLLSIDHIVAIGGDAAQYSRGLGVDVVTVRHPSYGGVSDFRAGMRQLYADCFNGAQFELGILGGRSRNVR